MKILICGDGKVGYALAEKLSGENHDVTIVDNNADALARAVDKLDVLCINGSATSRQTLMDASVEDKDLVVAVTSRDEVNMICALLAHKMSKARIVSRIRNPEYADTQDFIGDLLGIDMSFNPELYAAGEISRLLRFSHAHSLETFAAGKVELVEFPLGESAPIVGKPLAQAIPKLSQKILIGLVSRDGEIFTPDGATQLQSGDHIFVVGSPQQNVAFAKFLGIPNPKLRDVMIVGGSRIGYYLARDLGRMGMHCTLIEVSAARSRELSELLPEATIINDDGTDHEVLEREQLDIMDAFVALTDRDEENILAGMKAQDAKVAKVVARVSRPYYARIASGMSTISPKDLAAERIVRYVRATANSEGSFVERLHQIAGGQAEVMEFVAGATARVTGVPLRNLKLKRGLLVAAVLHRDHMAIASGETVIREGDTVIIIATGERVFLDINDILQAGMIG